MKPESVKLLLKVVLLFLGASPILGAAEPPAAQTKSLDRVNLQLKWQHQFQFAGYYAALEQGFYREAGLDVHLLEAQPADDPVEVVLSEKAEFGVGTSELLLLRSKGRDVVVLGAVFQHSPLVLLARRNAGINDLHDLVGKPVMIEPQSAELFAYLQVEGIKASSLVIQHHTFSVDDLASGKVAAMSAYSTDEPFQLQQRGVEYLTFNPRAGGIDFYGDNLFTTERQIRKHPERVRAFRTASLRGWEYALAHREGMVDLILQKYSKRKSRAILLQEAEQTAQLMHPALIEVGHMNPGRWRHIADTYADFGMVPRNLDLAGFLYDPSPHHDPRQTYVALWISLLIAAAAIAVTLPLYRLNRRLVHEIGERRAVEASLREAKRVAEEADQTKGRYLAFMAHEVRSPLAGITGLLDLIGTESLGPAQRENLRIVQDSAANLLTLINKTLDYSKIEAGRLQLEIWPVNIRDFLHSIKELFRPAAQAKALTLECQVDSGVPEDIHTDPTRLRQILTNLVGNAVKFTERGSVTVRAELAQGSDLPSDAKLVLRVQDTGRGISPKELESLFQPYAQVKPQPGGTGLGLVISRQLARMLGGDISVESTPGQGSSFTVMIAIAPPATAIIAGGSTGAEP